MHEIELLEELFKKSRNILVAIGDENRQHLILMMMSSHKPSGLRVGEITSKTNLSRPAVSHHLKILKDAGLVKVRKEGTKNYYYFDGDQEVMDNLIEMFTLSKKIMSNRNNLMEDTNNGTN